MSTPRMTKKTKAILRVLAAAYPEPIYSMTIMKQARVWSGTLYPVLYRLTDAGWVEPSWEKLDPSEDGRPRRRFYRLTDEGKRAAAHSLAGSR